MAKPAMTEGEIRTLIEDLIQLTLKADKAMQDVSKCRALLYACIGQLFPGNGTPTKVVTPLPQPPSVVSEYAPKPKTTPVPRLSDKEEGDLKSLMQKIAQ